MGARNTTENRKMSARRATPDEMGARRAQEDQQGIRNDSQNGDPRAQPKIGRFAIEM